ncbi:hypothetical protein CAL29_23565 [Bordetella genomosp. 10]|uniref:Iron dicitrate transport regulator FecR n=1 Tax=Bordetella genomosp. 10 TaxID=1416804 RepID=A0A261S2B7_9BORD|nr:FecR family protein [Bordetella genomosp. 10]OZI30940.1 hypothetical protein CAL29_23565 [Bordetella genomosp. 10]
MASASPLEAAIDWMVLMRSGEAQPDDWERLRAWCDADPRNASAWAQVGEALQASMAPLQAARSQSSAQGAAVQAALLRPARRRSLRRLAVLAGLAAGTGWLLQRQGALPAMMADLRTGTGERRSFTLEDGSQVVLNACSAVDIDFSSQQRLLRLRAGALIATVMPDPARPFVVASAEGAVRALGTRFLVSQETGRTQVAVLEHSVRLSTRAGAEETLREGEEAWFDATAISPPTQARRDAAAWEHGMLVARDEPLDGVIDALRPYYRGFIRVAPDAARLRVLGAFPLDRPERAIESLAQTLPIHVARYGDWLVWITLRQQPG